MPQLYNNRKPVNYGDILSKSGEQDQADLLFDRILELIRKGPRLGAYGYWVTDVQVYAQRSQKEQALAALRQAVDEGWRYNWWYHFEHDASLEPIGDDSEFQAMLAEVKADMAEQLARVREMEASGEIAAPKNK